jgi:hypothetical protein
MTVTRESLLEHFRSVRAELMASLEGLSAAQMAEATVDGWSVKDNLAHIAFWDDQRADEITRISAGHDSVLHMSGGQDDTMNMLVYELRRDLSLEQVMWELRHSRERLEAAIGNATERALDPSRYGEAGLLSEHDRQHAGYFADWRQRMGY